MHEWQVPFDECVSAASSRDQHVFAAAASRYRERLSAEEWIDDVMLGSKLTAAIREGEVATPEKLVLAGFDRLTPEVDALLAALRERGTRIDLATAEDALSRAKNLTPNCAQQGRGRVRSSGKTPAGVSA